MSGLHPYYRDREQEFAARVDARAETQDVGTDYVILGSITTDLRIERAKGAVEALHQWIVAEDLTGYGICGYPQGRPFAHYEIILYSGKVTEKVFVAELEELTTGSHSFPRPD